MHKTTSNSLFIHTLFCLGVLFVRTQQAFYGPQQRKMGGLGFIRLGVWQNFIRAWKSGYQGNMNGEGFILGGVFVIGSGEQVIYVDISLNHYKPIQRFSTLTVLIHPVFFRFQGVLLEHREKEFGDKVSLESVLEAAKKIVVEK